MTITKERITDMKNEEVKTGGVGIMIRFKRRLALLVAMWVFSCLILFIFISHAFAQSPENAVLALKKLEAKCSVGINYHDYIRELGEVKYSINLFLEEKHEDGLSKTKMLIKQAYSHYEFAGDLWRHKIEYRNIIYVLPGEEPLRQLIDDRYPDAPTWDGLHGMGKKAFGVDTLLPFMWGKATQDIKEASNALQEEREASKGWYSKPWKYFFGK